jgi:hypothetical protein
MAAHLHVDVGEHRGGNPRVRDDDEWHIDRVGIESAAFPTVFA